MKIEVQKCWAVRTLTFDHQDRVDITWDSPEGRYLRSLGGICFDDDGIMGTVCDDRDWINCEKATPLGVDVQLSNYREVEVLSYETVGDVSGYVVPLPDGRYLLIKEPVSI